VRPCIAVALLVLAAPTTRAQMTDTVAHHDKTFLTRRDLALSGLALAGTALLSRWDTDIAKASQVPTSTWQGSGIKRFARNVSKVQETTLTVAGLLTYGIGRATGQKTLTDVALHATESILLASVASQVIRGPLGRARPYATGDTNAYDFKFMGGFRRGESGFKRRAFPSIHTSSSMAVATVLTMEMQRRHVAATPYVAPILFAAGMLPGLARIQLDQHWASDIAAGAFIGVLGGYKVVTYSHDHPDNFFDRTLLKMTVSAEPTGGMRIGFAPSFEF
jgi:membrane-associated phospholipid phosphatase